MTEPRKRHDLVGEPDGCMNSAGERAKPRHRETYCHQQNTSCKHYEACLDAHLEALLVLENQLSPRAIYEREKNPFKRYQESKASCYEPRELRLGVSLTSNLSALCGVPIQKNTRRSE